MQFVARPRPDPARAQRARSLQGGQASPFDAWNGLRGIRERLGAYGGRVDIITGRGQGFALDIRLPLENPA